MGLVSSMISPALVLPFVFCSTPAVLGSAPAAGADAINIGSRVELLVDHYLIERLQGAALELGRPRDEGVAIRFDRPWEFPYAGCATVIKDGAKYIMIYRGMNTDAQGMDGEEFTCYAESTDGVQWTKPDLGLYEVHGTRKNNVILAREQPFSHN